MTSVDYGKDGVGVSRLRDCFSTSLIAQPDGNYGMDGEYPQLQVLARNEALYFKIVLKAKREWIGC